MSAFEQLGVQGWLAKQCAYMALHNPTPIQQRCIPVILRGHHVVGGAATGSGKTAAFALPILQELSEDVYGVFALVLTPSRELAYQICDQFIALGAPLRVRTMLAIGGVRHEEQVDALKSRPPVVVATPGRLLHLLRTYEAEVKRAFGHLRFLVLDEADRLTEGDIRFSVRDVLRHLPPATPKRQVLLFTATLEARLTASPAAAGADAAAAGGENNDAEPCWPALLGLGTGNQPVVVCNLSRRVDGASDDGASDGGRGGEIVDREGGQEEEEGEREGANAATSSPASSLSTVAFPKSLQQTYVFIPDIVKLPNLVAALRAQGKEQSTIVFTNSCVRAELVRLTLQLLGFPVCSLNSLLTQQHRLDNLALFKLGIARILVATDIASRGLDIPVVRTVMHYDVPKHAASYVHRVGRTARAGREGTSVAFVTEHDIALVQRMEKKLRIALVKWPEKALREERILKILDEVSAAKVQARQQVAERYGTRAATLKTQAALKKAERRDGSERARGGTAAPVSLSAKEEGPDAPRGKQPRRRGVDTASTNDGKAKKKKKPRTERAVGAKGRHTL